MQIVALYILFLVILLLNVRFTFETEDKESCFSPVYCYGPMLHLIQMTKIYPDSKRFVDMSMRHPINKTLENYEKFISKTKRPKTYQIERFILENFDETLELEEYWLNDFKEEPKLIREIENPLVRKFAKEIQDIWPNLARRVSSYVIADSNSVSLIPVDHGFIMPGGRFKEYYYWDSYWILDGLLICEMYHTAKGVVLNLLSIVERYGFVPNGGRVYYLNRSQPPMLTIMLATYIKYTNDHDFITKHIGTLEKELSWWLENRTKLLEKNGTQYRLAHFDSESNTPRPEAYREDVQTCTYYTNKDDIRECYTDIKAGAESGWDFSSRWIFDKKGGVNANLSFIQTRRNIPADLNSFLYKCFKEMFNLYTIIRNDEKAKYWLELSREWRNNIEEILWNEEDGIWYDYDRVLKKHRRRYYASNIVPLWAQAVEAKRLPERAGRVAAYLERNNLLSFHGGIPISFVKSSHQWDFPNSWPNVVSMIAFGLENSGNETAREIAKCMAMKWVRSNIKAFYENGVMFEKYHAPDSGIYGGGGEYRRQSGFGWTNGVMMQFISYWFRSNPTNGVLFSPPGNCCTK